MLSAYSENELDPVESKASLRPAYRKVGGAFFIPTGVSMATIKLRPRMNLSMLQEVVNSPTISIDKKVRTLREEFELLVKEQELMKGWLDQLVSMQQSDKIYRHASE